MLQTRFIIFFILLVLLFLSIGCSEKRFSNISDCDTIRHNLKRDKCFINFIDGVPSNETNLRTQLCNSINNTEFKDACFLKTAQDGWKFMSSDNLSELCSTINESSLRESCDDINRRPHLKILL